MKLKLLIFVLFVSVFLLISFFSSLPDGKLHVVFCDVGEGDAIYLRFPDGTDGLIDGGPNNKVLSCLGKYMPFWDRKIELVFLTHPQADHINGLIEVANRYEIEMFFSSAKFDNNDKYKNLEKILKEKKTEEKQLHQGDVVQFDDKKTNIALLWPPKSLTDLKQAGKIDLNFFSLSLLISIGKIDLLIAGDLESKVVTEALQKVKDNRQIELLKVSHHGAKEGLDDTLLSLVKPQSAIISVGKDNHYKHPHSDTLRLLDSQKIEILRTDQKGDIEIVTDGKKIFIKTQEH